MFTKIGLVVKLTPIITEAKQNGEVATAAILSGLCAALLMGQEERVIVAMKPIMDDIRSEAEKNIREMAAADAELEKVFKEMEKKTGVSLRGTPLDDEDFFDKNDTIQ